MSAILHKSRYTKFVQCITFCPHCGKAAPVNDPREMVNLLKNQAGRHDVRAAEVIHSVDCANLDALPQL
jgi:hypothetical protein